MKRDLKNSVAEIRESSPHWDEEVFERFLELTVPHLEASLSWGEKKKVIPVFTQLGAEAIGQGLIKHVYDPKWKDSYVSWVEWNSVLEILWTMIVPTESASLPGRDRVSRLVDLWNLADNLHREAAWIDPFIVSQIKKQPPALPDFESFLAETLQPMLDQTRHAWEAPVSVEIIDCSEVHSDFLPGDMYFSAPSVICVRDRRNEGLFGGIFLTGEAATLVGHHRDFGRLEVDPESVPEIELASEMISVAGNRETARLPFLAHRHSHVAGASAVAVSALDSQRVWIVRPSD